MALKKVDQELTDLLRKTGSSDKAESLAALAQFAQAVMLPLREGVMSGPILDGPFEAVDFTSGSPVEYPLDFVAPGTEDDYVAYTIPSQGQIPYKQIEGDYVMIPTYRIGAAIDWRLNYARDARWDIVTRAMQVLEAMFVKKMNDDGWHTILGAGVDRNIMVFDSDAAAGQFTKRLVSLLKTTMRRNGGGNSTSQNRGQLTDLFISPEAMEDIRNWGVDQIDEVTRREIYVADDNIARIFRVNLHSIDELGENQEYELYFRNELGGSGQGSDLEICVGLDLRDKTFLMPVREEISIFEDDNLHRSQRAGLYGWGEFGFAGLDNRKVILGSM